MSIESFIEFGKATEKVATALGDLAQALDVVSQTPCFTTPLWKENPSVMISINPKWCELIASGRKTIEVRRTRPKVKQPFKCYIYQTKYRKGNGRTYSDGKIIGEFICDKITICVPTYKDYDVGYWDILDGSCLTCDELFDYGKWKTLYGWHISDLVIYDKPKELNEFYVLDNEEVKKCKNRIQTYYSFTDTGYIKNGMYCDYKDDWCVKCKRKPLKRPFQSWGYAENYTEAT